ncbi:MAG TPA: hypothetical protein VH158_06940 [Gemmatimonadales bacterium]|nr:hypothetical protein [Gemmatimonadales bacterium]
MGASAPLRRPIPVARSILWAPESGDVRPSEIPFPIFLGQDALTAIHEHVATAVRPGQGMLGFLLGDLCECPDTNVSYLVIDTALRLNQAIYSDRSRDVVTRLWDRIAAQLEEQQAHLIGWYHTHAPLPLTLSDDDVETHEQYFAEPWQVAMLVEPNADEPAGAFFRAGGEGWTGAALPFYELLADDSIRAGGRKRSFVTWKNYRAYNPVVPQSTATLPAAAVKPPADVTSRSVPVRPAPEPEPPSSPPPPREERSTELKFLTTAEDFATPAPSRAPPPPPRPRPAPPRPPRAAPPPEPEPEAVPATEEPVDEAVEEPLEAQVEEPLEEVVEESVPAADATQEWPDEFEERGDAVAVAEYEEPEAAPAPPKPRRPRKPRPGLWRALIAVAVLAVAGGAYWWFQPTLPSLTVPQVIRDLPARAGALASRIKALASHVKELPFLKPRPAASKPPTPRPSRTPPPAPPRSQLEARPPTPPPPRATVPVAPSAPAPALDRFGDAVALGVRRFNDRAAQFDRHEITCADLAGELGAVERSWAAYSTARRAAGVLDAAHATRDQTLYAGVDAAAHRLENAGCERQPQ